MLSFTLGVVLCHCVEYRMSRPKQLADIFVQKLQLFSHCSERIYCNIAGGIAIRGGK